MEKKETGQLLSFSINDTGIGIPLAKQDALFHAFTQADGSTTRKYGGTGLGLTICKKLVVMMGGEIGVESEVNEGSTFWFTAWFSHFGDYQKIKNYSDWPSKESLYNARIIAVDDNKTNRRLLDLLFDSWQCHYEIVENPMEVIPLLEKAQKEKDPFRIGILDMQMPDMDGPTLGRLIQDTEGLDTIQLILMTTLNDQSDRKRFLDEGFAAYLTKPIKQSELFNCIHEIVYGDKWTGDESEPENIVDSPEISHDCRILLVEDNEINQQVASVALTYMGFYSEIAANGLEAINTMEIKNFDLILMDCQMPEMDGYEATLEIRKREGESEKHIPIIAMTANAMKGDLEKCLAVGMDDHVAKPIDFNHLYATITKWLDLEVQGDTTRDFISGDKNGPQIILPDLAAINLSSGLTKYDGDQDLYFKTLKKFSANHRFSTEEIRTALKQEDSKQAERIAHTIKGLAGLIGAAELEETARALETGISKNIETVKSLLENVETHLARVLVDIETVTAMASPQNKKNEEKTTKNETEKSSDHLKKILKQYVDLLEEDLTEAEERLVELKNYMAGTENETSIASISEALEEYDYDKVKKEVADLVCNLVLSGKLL